MQLYRQFMLREFYEKHRDAKKPLKSWIKAILRASWGKFAEVRQDYAHADLVGNVVVFNIKGNHYRLVARIDYEKQQIVVEAIMTHAVYDRNAWKGK
jgi:mRNA interferase HigB